jgi:F-type H+-transporting ATPase subunit b
VVDNPLVRVDPGLFIWTIVTFLVLVFLLRRFAWGPLLAALERRQQAIAAAVDDARRTKEELERVQRESAQVLNESRREAEAILGRARADAERFREDLRTKAAAEAANITRNAEKQIQQETARAIGQLRQEAIDLSVAIASKLLRRTVTREDNERLILDVIERIDRPAH